MFRNKGYKKIKDVTRATSCPQILRHRNLEFPMRGKDYYKKDIAEQLTG